MSRHPEVIVDHVEELQAALRGMQIESEKALDRTLSDFRTRMPGWIATEVVKYYGIKKAEIMPQTIDKRAVGSIKASGKTISMMQLVYKGRVLTPTHFGMTPTMPKDSYTLKAQITKGNKAVLGQKKKLTKKQRRNIGKNFRRQGTQNSDRSPIMLMPTGTSNPDKVPYIPFQRVSKDRNDIMAVKTLSLPQMISSDGRTLKPEIADVVYPKLMKRLEHHAQGVMK